MEDAEPHLFHFYRTEQLAFLWTLFIVIVLGNSLVLITLFSNKKRRPRMSFFIMHLAISDLLVGFVSVSTDIYWRTTIAFNGGNFLCKLVKFLQVLVTYGSTYMLVTLSLDRLDAVRNPLSFGKQESRAGRLVAGAWALSALFSLPAVFLNSQVTIKGMPQCWIRLQPWQWRLYLTSVCVTLFCVPALIIACCYVLIVVRIWQKPTLSVPPVRSVLPQCSCHAYSSRLSFRLNHSQAQRQRNRLSLESSSSDQMSNESTKAMVKSELTANSKVSEASAAAATTSSSTACSHHYKSRRVVQMRSSSEGVIPKARIKTIKMTFVIVLAFIICWCPYFVWDMLQVYGYIPFTQQSIAISTFIQSLAPLNSAASPIIYCFFSSKEVVQCIRKLWSCELCHMFNKNSSNGFRKTGRTQAVVHDTDVRSRRFKPRSLSGSDSSSLPTTTTTKTTTSTSSNSRCTSMNASTSTNCNHTNKTISNKLKANDVTFEDSNRHLNNFKTKDDQHHLFNKSIIEHRLLAKCASLPCNPCTANQIQNVLVHPPSSSSSYSKSLPLISAPD